MSYCRIVALGMGQGRLGPECSVGPRRAVGDEPKHNFAGGPILLLTHKLQSLQCRTNPLERNLKT
jgi:hypothetical protein